MNFTNNVATDSQAIGQVNVTKPNGLLSGSCSRFINHENLDNNQKQSWLHFLFISLLHNNDWKISAFSKVVPIRSRKRILCIQKLFTQTSHLPRIGHQLFTVQNLTPLWFHLNSQLNNVLYSQTALRKLLKIIIRNVNNPYYSSFSLSFIRMLEIQAVALAHWHFNRCDFTLRIRKYTATSRSFPSRQ